MNLKEIRIIQLKTRNKELRQELPIYDDLPNAQVRIVKEIKLNEEIIKFLEKDGFVCRVESEVEEWVYDKYQEAYYKTGKSHSNYIVITNKEFIAQLEKYSQ